MSKSQALQQEEEAKKTPLEKLADSSKIIGGYEKNIAGQEAHFRELLIDHIDYLTVQIKKQRVHFEKKISDIEKRLPAA